MTAAASRSNSRLWRTFRDPNIGGFKVSHGQVLVIPNRARSDNPQDMKIFQVTFLVVLGAWTAHLFLGPLDAASNSFVHLIDLVFHEAGHPIFAPLGEFMMVLGGSLMQILVPLICAGTFLVQQEDEFGAAVCVWWA